MQETWVQSLGWEDPLEKGKATPVFWPGEFHGPYSPWSRKGRTRLSDFYFTALHFTVIWIPPGKCPQEDAISQIVALTRTWHCLQD